MGPDKRSVGPVRGNRGQGRKLCSRRGYATSDGGSVGVDERERKAKSGEPRVDGREHKAESGKPRVDGRERRADERGGWGWTRGNTGQT